MVSHLHSDRQRLTAHVDRGSAADGESALDMAGHSASSMKQGGVPRDLAKRLRGDVFGHGVDPVDVGIALTDGGNCGCEQRLEARRAYDLAGPDAQLVAGW
jgi:hypothetical protein